MCPPGSLSPGILKPPSGTLRGLEWETQTAQSGILGLPASYRTYRRDTPSSIDRGTRQSEGDRGGRAELTGQIPDNEKPEPGRVFPPSQNPVWNLNSAKRRMCLE